MRAWMIGCGAPAIAWWTIAQSMAQPSAPATMSGQVAGAEVVRFIACPIYRDTDAGRKSGCWLADEASSGRRFDVSASPTKPDWNYEVLVEGRVSNRPTTNCGGKVLDPVRVSVLPGACTRHMLPAEGFPGNAYVIPPRNVRPIAEPRPAPPQMPAEKTFHLLFDFDRAFVVYQLDDFLLDQAVTYIRAASPREIAVTGWAATGATPVSGRSMAERPAIARTRAELVRDALVRLGVPLSIIRVDSRTDAGPVPAEGADGLVEPSRRRADIVVRR